MIGGPLGPGQTRPQFRPTRRPSPFPPPTRLGQGAGATVAPRLPAGRKGDQRSPSARPNMRSPGAWKISLVADVRCQRGISRVLGEIETRAAGAHHAGSGNAGRRTEIDRGRRPSRRLTERQHLRTGVEAGRARSTRRARRASVSPPGLKRAAPRKAAPVSPRAFSSIEGGPTLVEDRGFSRSYRPRPRKRIEDKGFEAPLSWGPGPGRPPFECSPRCSKKGEWGPTCPEHVVGGLDQAPGGCLGFLARRARTPHSRPPSAALEGDRQATALAARAEGRARTSFP